MKQRTIKSKVNFSGVGIHSGVKVDISMMPAAENHGIEFRVKERSVRLHAQNVVKMPLCTAINIGHGKHIKTVEHLLSALNALLIDNIIIELNGYEVPSVGGNAEFIFQKLLSAGIKHQSAIKFSYLVTKPVEVRQKEKFAKLIPGYQSSFSFTVNFNHLGLASQHYKYVLDEDTYLFEIAKSRTFGFLSELKINQNLGISLGAKLDNCLMFDKSGKLANPELQTYPEECARHKILDAVGDLYVVGRRIIGGYVAYKSGHFINNLLIKKALSENALALVMHDPKPSEVMPFVHTDKLKTAV